MRAVLLLAANFAREQRWPLFFLLLWVLGWALFGLVDPERGPEDALVFFGSSAIQADQRSRRVLAVLSKGISRQQYLLGLLAGMGLVLGIFCLCMGFTATWLLGRFGVHLASLWLGMLALWTACLLTASLTLAMSTFLPPLFSAIATGTFAGIPALLALRGDVVSKFVIPVYGLVEPLIASDFAPAWHARPLLLLLGWVEAAVFWIIASWIFSRRDLAVAAE